VHLVHTQLQQLDIQHHGTWPERQMLWLVGPAVRVWLVGLAPASAVTGLAGGPQRHLLSGWRARLGAQIAAR
jgi:hypothetical protein